MFAFTLSVAVSLILYGMYRLVRVPKDQRQLPRVPLLTTVYHLIHNTPFDEQVLSYSAQMQDSKLISMFNAGRWMVVTTCPTLFKKMFNDPSLFDRMTVAEEMPNTLLAKLMGVNVATSNGKTYSNHFKIVKPGFTKPIDKVKMMHSVNQLVALLASQGNTKEGCKYVQLVQKLTIDLLGQLVLGIQFDSLTSKEPKFIEAYNALMVGVFDPLFVLCPWLDVPSNPLRKKLHQHKKYLDDYFLNIYNTKLQLIEKGVVENDVLTCMLLACKDEKVNFGVQEVQHNVITLFTAGHETTTSAITCCLHLLATHPQVQKRLRDELVSFDFFHNFEKVDDTANHLPFLNGVILETLRLYPGVGRMFPRKLKKDFDYLGNTFAKGTYFMLDTLNLQRSESFYPNPNQFLPHRFLNGKPDPIQLSPFFGGTHLCIGKKFSLIQQKLAIASLILKFDILPVDSYPKLKLKNDFMVGPDKDLCKLRFIKL